MTVLLAACGGVDAADGVGVEDETGTITSQIHGGLDYAAPPPVGASDPLYADLVPVGPVEFYDSPNAGFWIVRISVSNAGNASTISNQGEIVLNYGSYPATLGPDTLGPGGWGYLYAEVPKLNGTVPTVEHCSKHNLVQIDTTRTMQRQQDPDNLYVYSNDSANLKSQCLTWSEPITIDFVNEGLPAGASLEDIVSSKVIATPRGLCSNCHNNGGRSNALIYPTNYHPNIARNSSSLLVLADTVVSRHTWDGTKGGAPAWASRFTDPNLPYSKPPALLHAFTQWKANGSLQVQPPDAP